ncbi:MAG: G1 family endopeptidase [Actinomycetota bacterium]|nr:G1 family endopeptidase [Actinomycetota bacterium]
MSTVICRPGRRHLPASPIKTSPRASSASYYSSATWSGYISEGWKQVNDVYSSWNVPTAGAPAPGPTATTQSTWIGTGGWNGQPGALIQEGTESNTAANGSTHYFPWYEIVPDEAQQIFANDPINPGDDINASLQVTPNDNVVFTKGSFLLCDEAPGGVCVSLSQDTKAFETPGTSAEWIIERTIVNNTAPPLTRFGSLAISMDGFYADGASHYEDGAVSINMNSCDGKTTLASVGALYNTNQFLDTWMNYGPSDPFPCP